jgi:putative transposase
MALRRGANARNTSIQEKLRRLAPNLLREEELDWNSTEIIFSDIFEVRLADRSRVRGCFALRYRTRHVLGIAFDYHMRADLVTDAIQTLAFEGSGSIWHSDQGKQYGAEQTRQLLLRKGFVLSMSRAGTPTDNGYAERVRRCAFILLVGEVQHH